MQNPESDLVVGWLWVGVGELWLAGGRAAMCCEIALRKIDDAIRKGLVWARLR